MKKCRVCKTKFEPFNSLQQVCSTACALQKAQKDFQKDAERKAKEQRKWIREQKAKVKSRGEHLVSGGLRTPWRDKLFCDGHADALARSQLQAATVTTRR